MFELLKLNLGLYLRYAYFLGSPSLDMLIKVVLIKQKEYIHILQESFPD